MPDRRKYSLILIAFVLITALIITIFLTTSRTSSSSQARNNGQISLENSYLFASPLNSCADGLSRVRITVFLLNTEGLGVRGQKVELVTSGGLAVETIADLTDSFGKAYFDIASQSPGKFTIGTRAAGQNMPQTVDIVFADSSSCSSK